MSPLRWLPSSGSEAETDSLLARPFGASMTDLDVDFSAPPEAAMTGLLAACLADRAGTPFTSSAIAGWSIKKRRQGLIAVAVATFGPEREVTARCPQDDCGTVMEITLDLMRFRTDWRAERIALALDDKVVHLRPPRPADLAAWAEGGYPEPAALAARLMLGGGPPDGVGWAEAAEEAMAEDDWLTGLTLEAACPECGHPTAVPLVLEDVLMRDLATRAAALLDEVHMLASAYHWTEAAIVALPPTRRAHYLSRIAEAWS